MARHDLPLGEAVLAVSDHMLIPHVIEHVIQEDLFHDLSRRRGETHRPVVPQVLLAPFLVNGSDVTLPPVVWDLATVITANKSDGCFVG